jgi:ribonuclease P protein component
MLKKKERISRKAFSTVFTQSKVVYRGSFFIVKKQENTEKTTQFQASVVISKKIAKKATERNYLKRILYNLIAQYKKNNLLFSGTYIFIYQKKPLSFTDLQNDFKKNFN